MHILLVYERELLNNINNNNNNNIIIIIIIIIIITLNFSGVYKRQLLKLSG